MPTSSFTTDNAKQDAKVYYSEDSFWRKLKRSAKQIGTDALEKLLTLYYCFRDPATPAKEKAIILGALGYFIMPFDAIPDLLPMGWTDDIAVIALAFSKVVKAINDSHIEKAKLQLNKLFNKA
ncbi:YkvA family protein [Kangiella marina]|uniref:YkvA family protein n=1 Tax=Kangiella marina TaxID=1079178 RepID=A0ABP8IMA8_9GAMM